MLRAEVDRAVQELGSLGSAILDATRTGAPAEAEPSAAGHAAPGTGFSDPRATDVSRPMLINGEPYQPDAPKKRWWQRGR